MLKVMFCIGLIGFLLSIALDFGDVKSGVFLIIMFISCAGINIVKNIYIATGRHIRHNAKMMDILIDKLNGAK